MHASANHSAAVPRRRKGAAAAALLLLSVLLTASTPVVAAAAAAAQRSQQFLSTNVLPHVEVATTSVTAVAPLGFSRVPSVGFIDCKNGGRIDGITCICPIYYTGKDCSVRQCPNSIDGEGPYSILPVNNDTMFCDACNTADFNGLGCQLCQRDQACGVYAGSSAKCNNSVVIRGDNKQFQCKLNDKHFLRELGDGRNITAEIVLNCSTTNGEAFINGDTGRCSMAIYRIEENNGYVDPFFRCETSQCSMAYSEMERQYTAPTVAHRVFAVIRVVGQVTLVCICALLALLGLLAGALGHRRLTRVTVVLASALGGVVLLYIFLMTVSMQPLDPEVAVVYDCKKTKCLCAEDPPSRYPPICSESDVLVNHFLPAIKNSIRITCLPGSSKCKLILTDVTFIFDVDCTATECVDESLFPINPKKDDGDEITFWTRDHVMQLLMLGIALSFIGLLLHWFYIRRRSVERAKEFLVLFNVAQGTNDDGDDDDESGSSGRPARTAGGGPAAAATDRAGDLHIVGDDGSRGGGSGSGAHEVEVPDGEAGERLGLLSSASRGSLDDGDDDDGSAVHDSRRAVRASVIRRASHLTPTEQAHIAQVRLLTRTALELRVERLRYALKSACLADEADSDSRVILNNINFTAHSGDVLAIMGPSGAGKTTLLDLLSARAKSGSTSGHVLLNGTHIHTTGRRARRYRSIIGYVSQEDTLLPALTVRQTIEYAARLKLPTAFSRRTLRRIVNRTITALKLTKSEHTVVGNGDGVRGISGGEKRRVSIAVELLANPRILFLDEPTSGLDTVSAMRVIEAVVELAKDSPMQMYAPHYFAFRPIVIFSIHQPSAEIYGLFDQILLLSRGVSVYCGPAADAAVTLEHRVTEAFGRTRTIPHRDDHHNPAEYLMKLEEILDDNVRAELQEEDVRALAQRQGGGGGNGTNGTSAGEITVTGEDLLAATAGFRIYYANIYQQLSLLTSRAGTCLIGSFHLIVCHALVVACLASLMAFLYQEQALDLPGSLNRAGSCSFVLLVTSFVSLSCLEQLILERKLLVVERENGFYSTLPYLVSKLVVDILPLRILPAVVLSAIIYFPMGFRTDSGAHFLWFIFVIVLFSACITLLTMSIGIVTGTFGAAALISSVVILWNFVFGGAMVQAETIPSYLKLFKSASPFFLAFESLMVNELDGQACIFSPTDETGQPSEVHISVMCVQYLANIGLKPAHFSSDIMQLGVYCFALVGLAWFLLATCTRLVR